MPTKKSTVTILVLVMILSASSLAFLFKKKADPIYLTIEQLAQYDGKDGSPMYVAIDGVIYDLTKCKYWKAGIHNKSPEDAIAGRDMTEVLKKSKHGIKRVKGYPLVGYIVDSEADIPDKEQE